MKKIPHLFLACVLFACGDDSSGVDSGLPADTKGSALTAEDETRLCEAQGDHFATLFTADDAHRQGCVLAGATVAAMGNGSAASCQLVYDECIKKDPEPSMDPAGECTLVFTLSTCNATVAEIEACLSAKNELTAAALKDLSCADLDAEPADPNQEPAAPAACTKIESSCPGI